MPYYGMPVGTELEEVGFGFNHGVITGLLRDRYGFDGAVCSDWGLISDAVLGGVRWPARAWGVEHLSRQERVLKVIEAGVDQFGGEACPDVVVDLVRSGRVHEERIDESVLRLLRDKFRLGLFDDPYVDADAAADNTGLPEFVNRGYEAQTRSFVLLSNHGEVLPLRGAPDVYLAGLETTGPLPAGTVVDRPEDADIALVRIQAPYEPRNGNFIESLFHAGDLRFDADDIAWLLELMQQVPTVVDIYLDRAAVIPEIAQGAAAVLADFGATDAALLDVVFGRAAPSGALPFELPSSMESVLEQLPDVPHDSSDPLFPFGHGLSYKK
jgi:beta-glucosidase